MEYKDQVIAIVGASSGIGRGIAEVAAEKKPRGLVLAARRKGLLDELATSFRERYGVESLVVQTDVASHDDLRALVGMSIEKFGRLDAVINSAGVIQAETEIGDHPPEKNDMIIYTNLNQALNLAHFLAPVFEKQGNGVYITISSQAGEIPFLGEAAYNASKAGLNHAIRSIDLDFSKHREQGKQIYAFSIGPGFINTEEAKRNFPHAASAIESAMSPRQFAEIILPYITNPKESHGTHGPVRTIVTTRV